MVAFGEYQASSLYSGDIVSNTPCEACGLAHTGPCQERIERLRKALKETRTNVFLYANFAHPEYKRLITEPIDEALKEG